MTRSPGAGRSTILRRGLVAGAAMLMGALVASCAGGPAPTTTAPPAGCAADPPAWLHTDVQEAQVSRGAVLAAWRDPTVLVVRLCGRTWDLSSLPVLQSRGRTIREAEVTLAQAPGGREVVDLVYPRLGPASMRPRRFDLDDRAISFPSGRVSTSCDPALPEQPSAFEVERCGSLTVLGWSMRLPSALATPRQVAVDSSVVVPQRAHALTPPSVFALTAVGRSRTLRVRLAVAENEWTSTRCIRVRLTYFGGPDELPPRLVAWLERQTSPPLCLSPGAKP